MKLSEIKNLSTDEISENLFPEIKQNNHLNQYIKKSYYADLDSVENFFCIQNERYRNEAKIEDSIWIAKTDLGKLSYVMDKVKEIRKEKDDKKNENKTKIIKDKELRFNKIYDKNFLPKNQRKKAYEYFVLSNNVNLRAIKQKSIETFLSDIEYAESKLLMKHIKKEMNVFASTHKDWIVDNYSLKKKVSIYVESLNETFTRYIEIMYLNKKEVSKIRQILGDEADLSTIDISNIVFHLYNERFNKKINYEEYYILKMYHYILEHVNVAGLDYNNFIKAFRKVLYFYNKEEMLNEFYFQLFKQYLSETDVFSERQVREFGTRKKFRNKVNLELNEENAFIGIFLEYEKNIKVEFIELMKETLYVDQSHFNVFLDNMNQKIVSGKIDNLTSMLSKEIENSIKQYTAESREKFDAYPLDNLTEEQLILNFEKPFTKVYFSEIKKPPENLKKELNYEKINIITSYNKESFYSIIKDYLIKTIIKIDYKNSFDLARKYKRKIHFIIGQTNSGKTYTAFNKLVEASSGSYLSPLRLLALEGQREIEERGRLCSMLTGEEKEIKENSTFTSSTIEMLNISESKQKIVIDEIQMIKDPNRGWAWTQALIGSPAEEIILTGSEEVFEVVKAIAEYTKDEFTYERLHRKSPLVVMDDVVSMKRIKKGTALIAFSRRKVLELRAELKDRKVSVIYGNLGPEVRKEEARKFREGETEILIATDAIAMGLNLPIENVIFTTHEKNIKNEIIELEQQMVQQIGGRAGRYGLKDVGYVGALNNKTLNYVKKMINRNMNQYSGKVPIMPNLQYLKEISEIIKTTSIAELLAAFENFATFNSEIFYCTDLTKQIELAKLIDKYNFNINEGYTLSSAPVRENTDGGIHYFIKCIEKIVEYNSSNEDYKMLKSPNIGKFENKEKAKDSEILRQAEEILHDLELYYWFSNKYPNIFVDLEGVVNKRKILNEFIINSLKK